MAAFQHGEYSEEHVITIPGEDRTGREEPSEVGAWNRTGQLLIFRLDRDFRQRLRTRMADENRSLSDVVIFDIQLYVQQSALSGRIPAAPCQTANALMRQSFGEAPGPGTTAVAGVADLALTDEVTAYLRDLIRCGQSELLSATLAKLYNVGWPLRPLAVALGISRQAVLARVRHQVAPEVRSRVPNVPPPSPFPRRRSELPGGRRPHFTVKIDRALRLAAHQQAQHEGSSLSQAIERILEYYRRHGLPPGEIHLGDTTPTHPAARRKRGTSVPTAEADHFAGK